MCSPDVHSSTTLSSHPARVGQLNFSDEQSAGSTCALLVLQVSRETCVWEANRMHLCKPLRRPGPHQECFGRTKQASASHRKRQRLWRLSAFRFLNRRRSNRCSIAAHALHHPPSPACAAPARRASLQRWWVPILGGGANMGRTCLSKLPSLLGTRRRCKQKDPAPNHSPTFN